MTPNRFFDPLYGRIEFNEREMNLILSPEVQRLRYVRMCNINSLLISGASEPSRFEHVVGVMYLAKRWTAANGITGDEADAFHAAALLHDVQTGPFGHSMEYILADNAVPGEFRHDDVAHGSSLLYHQDSRYGAHFAGASFNAKERLGRLWDRVAITVMGQGPYGSMIAGRVDLDNIDNVVRLAYHVGVAKSDDAKIGIDLASDLKLEQGQLSASAEGIISLRRWQNIRRDLYSLLLHDWAEFSAKAMLSVAMELAVEHKLLNAADWILTDDGLIHQLLELGKGEAQAVGEFARRLQSGDLFEPLALWRTQSIDSYQELSKSNIKRNLEALANREIGGRCLVHFILDKGKTERAIVVRNRTTGHDETLGADTKELLVGVFTSKGAAERPGRRALAAIIDALAGWGITDLVQLDDPVAQFEGASPMLQAGLI